MVGTSNATGQMKGENMNRILKIGFCVGLFASCFGCEAGNVTGSDEVDVISNVAITVTETTASSSKLIAKGTITNNGSNIIPPWFVEGDFYSDSSFTFKLGGDSERINFALGNGESTGWELEFSSDRYVESEYPDFAVRNLRAYKFRE
jgi:hypothetical protein